MVDCLRARPAHLARHETATVLASRGLVQWNGHRVLVPETKVRLLRPRQRGPSTVAVMNQPAILPRRTIAHLQRSGRGIGTDGYRPASAWADNYRGGCTPRWDGTTTVMVFDDIALSAKNPDSPGMRAPSVKGGRAKLVQGAARRLVESISAGGANVSGWALTHAGPEQAAVVVDAVCMSGTAITAEIARYFADGPWTIESAPGDFGRVLSRAISEASAQWRDSGLLAPVCAAGFDQALRGTLETSDCIALGVKAEGDLWRATDAVIGYIRDTYRRGA